MIGFIVCTIVSAVNIASLYFVDDVAWPVQSVLSPILVWIAWGFAYLARVTFEMSRWKMGALIASERAYVREISRAWQRNGTGV